MRITLHTRIDDDLTERFLVLYRESFAPLDDKAVARQSLTDDEFREEMRLDSVLKFVGWDENREPCALALVATDLTVVPWISPTYFARRFPEQYERNAIYYFGALLVAPSRQCTLYTYALLRRTVHWVAINHGIAAFDCCRFTEQEIDLPRLIAKVTGSACRFDAIELDTQRYFAYVWTAWHERRGPPRRLSPASHAEVDLDLVALEEAEAAGATLDSQVRERRS
jgi:hypothetical protein